MDLTEIKELILLNIYIYDLFDKTVVYMVKRKFAKNFHQRLVWITVDRGILCQKYPNVPFIDFKCYNNIITNLIPIHDSEDVKSIFKHADDCPNYKQNT